MLDLLIGTAVAVLSGMGVGSGGLLVVYLTLAGGMQQPAAQALNLFFFIFAAGASTAVNIRRRNIAWGCVVLLGVGGVVGAAAGSALAAVIKPRVLRILFGLMLTFTGARGLIGSVRTMINNHKKKKSVATR